MKIAVIGATGYVGNAVVQELAGRGHEVTAFARNTDKVFQAQNLSPSPHTNKICRQSVSPLQKCFEHSGVTGPN